jgi:hypothetical protein
MTITPLDTCGLERLRGQKYRKVAESSDPLTRAVIDNYRIWRKANDPKASETIDASTSSAAPRTLVSGEAVAAGALDSTRGRGAG